MVDQLRKLGMPVMLKNGQPQRPLCSSQCPLQARFFPLENPVSLDGFVRPFSPTRRCDVGEGVQLRCTSLAQGVQSSPGVCTRGVQHWYAVCSTDVGACAVCRTDGGGACAVCSGRRVRAGLHCVQKGRHRYP
eukprot:3214345-Rhodomonas_salina.1